MRTRAARPGCGRWQAAAGAFTLVELIVVVTIIGIVFALVVPYAWRSVETGRAVSCTSQLRQIGVGLNAYLNDHELTMPTLKAGRSTLSDNVPVVDTVLLPYVRDKRIFACPSDPKIARASGTSYYWNVTINGQRIGSLDFMKLTDEPSKIPILSDKEAFHPYLEKKVNVLYADGHATKDLKFSTAQPPPPAPPPPE